MKYVKAQRSRFIDQRFFSSYLSIGSEFSILRTFMSIELFCSLFIWKYYPSLYHLACEISEFIVLVLDIILRYEQDPAWSITRSYFKIRQESWNFVEKSE